MKKINCVLAFCMLIMLFVLASCSTLHKHSFSDWTVESESTCTETGIKKRVCSCGKEETENIALKEHSFGNWMIATKATCANEGVVTRTCTVCNKEDTSVVDKDLTAHIWNDGEVTQKPTEDTTGIMVFTCTVCGKTKTEIIDKETHTHTYAERYSYDETNHWLEATCNHDVKKNLRVHTWDSGEITLTANPYREGVMTYTCTICKCTKNESIAKIGQKVDGEISVSTSPFSAELCVLLNYGNPLVSENQSEFVIKIYNNQEYLSQYKLTFDNSIISRLDINIRQNIQYTAILYIIIDGENYEVAKTSFEASKEGLSEDNPYIIYDKDDLLIMKQGPSMYFKLANDLDLEGALLSTIFTSSNKFSGHFDGNEKTISNFKLTSTTYLGIFGYVTGGTIKNLTVSNVSMSLNRNETYFGVIAGKVENGTIENCKVENCSLDFTPYSSTEGNVGMLVGIASMSSIINCEVNNCTLTITKARYKLSVGLFAGAIDQKTKVENSHAEGSITASVYYNDSKSGAYFNVGGFVGKDQSGINSVESCTVIADIKVTEDTDKKTQADDQTVCVGGFVGTNMNGRMSIKNCAAVCDIEVENNYATELYVGGFVGYAIDSANLNQMNITNCVYTSKENGITIIYNKEINEGYNLVNNLTQWKSGVIYYTKNEDGNYTTVDTTKVTAPASKTSYYVSSKYLYVGKTCGYSSIEFTSLYDYKASITIKYKDSNDTLLVDNTFVTTKSINTTSLSFLSNDIIAILNDYLFYF